MARGVKTVQGFNGPRLTLDNMHDMHDVRPGQVHVFVRGDGEPRQAHCATPPLAVKSVDYTTGEIVYTGNVLARFPSLASGDELRIVEGWATLGPAAESLEDKEARRAAARLRDARAGNVASLELVEGVAKLMIAHRLDAVHVGDVKIVRTHHEAPAAPAKAPAKPAVPGDPLFDDGG